MPGAEEGLLAGTESAISRYVKASLILGVRPHMATVAENDAIPRCLITLIPVYVMNV